MLSTWIVSIWLLCLSVPDIRSRNVPVWLIGVGGVLALAVSIAENIPEYVAAREWWSYAGHVLCGMIPGICLLLLSIVTKTIGYGDGAVLTLLGAAVGIRNSLLVLCIGLFFASLGSVALLVVKKVNRNTCLPFLPFLTVGWFLLMIK